MKIISEIADTRIIHAPDVKLKLYDIQSPTMVKALAINPEVIIIE